MDGSDDDNRSLTISRGAAESRLPLGDQLSQRAESRVPFNFIWRSAGGHEYPLTPKYADGQIQFPTTGESLPRFFYFSANQPVNAGESASLFSQLSRSHAENTFKALIKKQFPLIKDISIEISGGAPVLYATVPGVREKVPIPNVSGAITRLLAILLTMASKPGGVLLIDEMENGVYYTHHEQVWGAILSFVREFDCQIFTTTHSKEWLQALAVASDKGPLPIENVCLLRLSRRHNRPTLLTFSGKKFRDGSLMGQRYAVAKKTRRRPLTRLLLCEGPEDCRFFHRLITERNLPAFFIYPARGKDRIAEALNALSIEKSNVWSNIKHVLIVADNDDDPSERFANVCAQIESIFGPGHVPSPP